MGCGQGVEDLHIAPEFQPHRRASVPFIFWVTHHMLPENGFPHPLRAELWGEELSAGELV